MNKIRRVILAVLALAACGLLLAVPGSSEPDGYVITSLIRVLADPRAFHGRNIMTRGFLFQDNHEWYVCYSTEVWKLDPIEGGVLLCIPNGGLFVPKDERFVSGVPVLLTGRLMIAKGIPESDDSALRLYVEIGKGNGISLLGASINGSKPAATAAERAEK